jgi:hypothetical protein
MKDNKIGEMIAMRFWELSEDEQDLAERVYYETKGSIYVDSQGNLYERYQSSSERVNSRDCYAFDIFIGELENAKIRAQDRLTKN